VTFSKHFELEELIRSQYASRHGIAIVPTGAVVLNLQHLAQRVLDPIRDAWGGPIIIDSGWRSPAVNMAVGGVPTSDHLYGNAADIRPLVGSVDSLMKLISLIAGTLPIKQAIREFPPQGWVHVSSDVSGEPPRRQFLVAKVGANGPVYSPWEAA
jgi:hypothetical protein